MKQAIETAKLSHSQAVRQLEESGLKRSILDDVVVSQLPVVKVRPHNLPSVKNTAKSSVLLLDIDQQARNLIRSLGRDLGISVYVAPTLNQAARILQLRPDVGVAIMGVHGTREQILKSLTTIKNFRTNLALLALVDKVDADTFLELIDKGLIFRCLQNSLDLEGLKSAISAGFKRHHMLKKADDLGDEYYGQKNSSKMQNVQRSA